MFRVVAYSIFCGGEEGKGLGLGQKAERAAAREKERIQSDLVMGYIKCWEHQAGGLVFILRVL